MGNSSSAATPKGVDTAALNLFYSEKSWIDGAAVDQLKQITQLPHVLTVAAFPDLHVGKYGPVGCAVLANRIYPHLIGNDIGCGMSLFVLDVPVRKLRLDKVAQKLRSLEGGWDGDASNRLKAIGLSAELYPSALGTLGGGNHFCELQSISSVYDETCAQEAGLSKDTSLLLVHSGSRTLGTSVFETVHERHNVLAPGSLAANVYLQAHETAKIWAGLNRQIIAERAAEALRTSCRLLADSPHNFIEAHGSSYLHRKGAAAATGKLVPIAGSRDALSFLVRPTNTTFDALASLAHGSGRKYDRRSMVGRIKPTKPQRRQLERNSFGGHVICEDRNLLVEEAPQAYKDSRQVIADLEGKGLIVPVASLKPLVTFKRAQEESPGSRNGKINRLSQRRRDR